MLMTKEQIQSIVKKLKEQEAKPITLSTRRMVRLANEASPFGDRFYLLQKVYRVETVGGAFVVGADNG